MSDAPKFKTFRDLRSVPIAQRKDDSSSTRYTSTTSPPKNLKTETSPIRDFQKVPNSISRNLNLFRGKSKQVWDYLWSISRGGINPTRTVRKSRKEIKEGSKLGSMVTVDAAIEHLTNTGLLKVVRAVGSLSGNEYEIFTPEETGLINTSSTSISSTTSLTQKVDVLDVLETSRASITQVIENKDAYEAPNTSFKDMSTNDDEAFAGFIKKFQSAAEEISGKKLSKRDGENLEKIADLLILELKIAARRTDGISSVPAFLTEVLRRKLRRTVPTAKPSKTKFDTIGKPDSDRDYQIKPLDAKARAEALTQLREFAADEFLQDFKKWYTPDDWEWLIKELEKEPEKK